MFYLSCHNQQQQNLYECAKKGVRGNGSHLEKEIWLLPHISHHFHLLSTFRVRFEWGKLLWFLLGKVEQLCKCWLHPIQPVRDSCEDVCRRGNFISMLSVTKWMMKKVWHMRGKRADGGWGCAPVTEFFKSCLDQKFHHQFEYASAVVDVLVICGAMWRWVFYQVFIAFE